MTSFGDEKYASCAREIPDWVKNVNLSSIRDMTRFSGRKEKQSISVIYSFFQIILKYLNGKKLDFYK